MKQQFAYNLSCNKMLTDKLVNKLKDLKIPYYLEYGDDLLYEIQFECNTNDLVSIDDPNFCGKLSDNINHDFKFIGGIDYQTLLLSINNSDYFENGEFLYHIVCDKEGFLDIVDYLRFHVKGDIEIDRPNSNYSIRFKSKEIHYLGDSSDHIQIEILNLNSYRYLRILNKDIVEKLINSQIDA